ncbi:MAG: proline--tRNA ligase [Actinobacteria bacterium]|nr:proline--tRNA ligase [Actinomycetota bacterium]
MYNRTSTLYAPTLKEVPAEAEIPSHRLMLRAGMIRKVSAGIYTFLPLGLRSLRKIERIIREEMDRIGSQELLLPIVQPGDLWRESGRWSEYGPELARFTDRSGREYCLGPTHEEIITALIRNEVRSYRELPVSLYQINMKFRDEIRPRFGLLRGREFIMKDAYSFHASDESLQEHYDAQAEAYGRICDRLSLEWRSVKAESGQIGGSVTAEFMALSDTGEAELLYCACGWAANIDVAELLLDRKPAGDTPQALEKVSTPGLKSIAELAQAFNLSANDTVKTMAGKSTDGKLVLFFLPGDRELNPLKASWVCPGVELLTDDDFASFGIPKGSLGPIDPPADAILVADASLQSAVNWVVGANEDGFHYFNANPSRDFQIETWADISLARAGDPCPGCQEEKLAHARGIEVSQVFQLGTKYSESMGATFMSETGEEKPFVMGCYGVGVTRSLAAVVEQHHDDKGIVWPMSLAPFHVTVLPLTIGDSEVWPTAEDIFFQLSAHGIEAIIDDRDERAGVKFADAELIGYPVQVIVGKKGLSAGVVEVKLRDGLCSESVSVDSVVTHVVNLVTSRLCKEDPTSIC